MVIFPSDEGSEDKIGSVGTAHADPTNEDWKKTSQIHLSSEVGMETKVGLMIPVDNQASFEFTGCSRERWG
jgi:hypothetical protein